MRVTITTQLNCPPGRAWQEVQTSRLLRYVTAPLVAFKPVEPPSFPEVWREEKYLVGMRLFGLLPVGNGLSLALSQQIQLKDQNATNFVIMGMVMSLAPGTIGLRLRKQRMARRSIPTMSR